MVQMKMADPNCIKVDPIKILLRHSMGSISAAIEQNRSGFCLQPEGGGRATWMKNGGAGTEDYELHGKKLD
jgi:hypothetical protein